VSPRVLGGIHSGATISYPLLWQEQTANALTVVLSEASLSQRYPATIPQVLVVLRLPQAVVDASTQGKRVLNLQQGMPIFDSRCTGL
jgi:hypothetical protein